MVHERPSERSHESSDLRPISYPGTHGGHEHAAEDNLLENANIIGRMPHLENDSARKLHWEPMTLWNKFLAFTERITPKHQVRILWGVIVVLLCVIVIGVRGNVPQGTAETAFNEENTTELEAFADTSNEAVAKAPMRRDLENEPYRYSDEDFSVEEEYDHYAYDVVEETLPVTSIDLSEQYEVEDDLIVSPAPQHRESDRERHSVWDREPVQRYADQAYDDNYRNDRNDNYRPTYGNARENAYAARQNDYDYDFDAVGGEAFNAMNARTANENVVSGNFTQDPRFQDDPYAGGNRAVSPAAYGNAPDARYAQQQPMPQPMTQAQQSPQMQYPQDRYENQYPRPAANANRNANVNMNREDQRVVDQYFANRYGAENATAMRERNNVPQNGNVNYGNPNYGNAPYGNGNNAAVQGNGNAMQHNGPNYPPNYQRGTNQVYGNVNQGGHYDQNVPQAQPAQGNPTPYPASASIEQPYMRRF